MSDGPRMGWYDLSRVLGGQDFQVDAKAEIKWSRVVSVLIQGGL